MRFGAPRVSKALAAVALMAVGALIAVSLLADAGKASAWMEERRGHWGEDNQYDTGTDFDIDENAAACSILGLVEITLHGKDAPEATEYLLGPAAAGLFNLNTDIDADHPCDEDSEGVPAARLNELRALISFNHEDVPGGLYQLTASTDGTIRNSARVNVMINDLNEAPMLGVPPTVLNYLGTPVARRLLPTGDDVPDPQYAANVAESADIGDSLLVWEWVDLPGDASTEPVRDPDGTFQFHRTLEDLTPLMAFDEDSGDVLSYSLMAADSDGGITTSAFRGPFSIDADTGAITVTGTLDRETTAEYVMYIVVSDDDATPLSDSAKLTINIGDVNENPFFVGVDLDRMSAQQAAAYCRRDWSEIRLDTNPPIIIIDENTAIGSVIGDYDACDQDGDDFSFAIRNALDSAYFDIHSGTGQLSVDGTLDYEFKSAYAIEVEVLDDRGGQGQLLQRIRLNDTENENITPTPTRTAAPTATPTSIPGSTVTPTPTTTPGRVSQDVLHRVGALEQLLARLQTLIQSLQGVIAAQDNRIAAQDDMIAAQDGRIAALEAQMAAGALTPTPQPTATATQSPTPSATAEPTAAAASACVQAMRPGSVGGSWSSGCLTANPTHGNTYYARFYTFTLDAAADVTITLISDKPPYLYLLAGEGTSGDVLRQAGGDGQTSVAITDTLQAGSYTIEASTWRPKTLGDFTLTLTARE